MIITISSLVPINIDLIAAPSPTPQVHTQSHPHTGVMKRKCPELLDKEFMISHDCNINGDRFNTFHVVCIRKDKMKTKATLLFP